MTSNITVIAVSTLKDRPKGLIGDADYQITTLVSIGATLAAAFAGILSNSCNIRTFVAIGIKDGVTVSLLALSMSDLFYCLASVIFLTSWLCIEIEGMYDVIFPINPMAVSLFIADIGLALYTTTVLTTTYLAVARCMCVVKPLHFRNVFTRHRSIIIHISFAILAVSTAIPVLSQMGTRRQFDRRANVTRIVLWFSEIREQVKDIVFLFFDTIFSFATQIVVIVCVIVMAESLRKSAKFRRGISTLTKDEKNESDDKLSGKELQVVKQIVLISSLYILCSLPKMTNALYSLIEPEFDVGKSQQNFYFTMYYVRNFFEVTNSASTFLVYFHYNTAFRTFWLGSK